MKKNYLAYILLGASLSFTACDDFLETMPDNRAELDSAEKITKLLVSAYPQQGDMVIAEMASDNAMDNGSRYTIEAKVQEEAYLWEDITDTANDTPQSLWNAYYSAIAAANQALAAIEEMGNPESLNPQRGEALMCRAFGHFLLANLFCLPYDPATAASDLGLPYSTAPETQVKPHYERGNMEDLYAKINQDIEDGLPLIDDAIYTVPKYHFNKKAAYAFATRFNLYYKKFDKVIEYADVVLGNNPDKVLRNWYDIVIASGTPDFLYRTNAYINASDPAVLLLTPIYSSTGYWIGPYGLGLRYGHNHETICKQETGRAEGMWGTAAQYLAYKNMWGYDQKISVAKIEGFFHFTDKVNGIGYRMNVIQQFSTDETLLCRAEAYAIKNELGLAVADINSWLKSHIRMNAGAGSPLQVTRENIVNYYGSIECMPTDNSKRTIKKAINPIGFTVAEGDQMEIIQCILHLRRCETIHEGLRWQDIKRFGIEISHNREGLPNDVLKLGDPRRAFQLPADVITAGLEANPRN